MFFIDHNTKTTTWKDPRASRPPAQRGNMESAEELGPLPVKIPILIPQCAKSSSIALLGDYYYCCKTLKDFQGCFCTLLVLLHMHIIVTLLGNMSLCKCHKKIPRRKIYITHSYSTLNCVCANHLRVIALVAMSLVIISYMNIWFMHVLSYCEGDRYSKDQYFNQSFLCRPTPFLS